MKRLLCWFRPHQVDYLATFWPLAKARCRNCGRLLCCKLDTPRSCLPWDEEFEHLMLNRD